jgi:hypothetical protein
MKLYQILLLFALLLLVACSGLPARDQESPVPDNATVTPVAQPTQTSTLTPTVIGTWEMIIEGVIYDQSTGEPISGASVSYVVVHSYFPEIQAGRLKETRSDVHGEFKLPMIVHDTDNIHIVVEANEYSSYDEKLDLLGSRYLDIELTPQATDISP